MQDRKNHQICEFSNLQRLVEGEQCTIGSSLSWRYKLFKYHFWQRLGRPKKHYAHIWNICRICQCLKNFESENFWRLLGREKCILDSWLWRSMLFKMSFPTTFISIIKLYDQIWQKYFIKLLWISDFLMKIGSHFDMQIRRSKTQNFAWEPWFSDSAPLNYIK